MAKKAKSRAKAYKPKPICHIPITWRSNAGTAHVVLVDGKRKAQAARELGIDPAAVRMAVLRIEKTEKIVESINHD